MKNENQQLYKVLQHFEGMQKIDVLDLLHRLEVFLFELPSPITKRSLQKAMHNTIAQNLACDHYHRILLPNGDICNLVGANDWIYIYQKEQKRLLKLLGFTTYYFTTSRFSIQLKKLHHKNLHNAFKNTAEEVDILDFLQKNNRVTNAAL